MNNFSGSQQIKMVEDAFDSAIDAMICDLNLVDQISKTDLDDIKTRLTSIVDIKTEDGKSIPIANIELGAAGMLIGGIAAFSMMPRSGFLSLFASLANLVKKGLQIKIGLISINALSIIPLLNSNVTKLLGIASSETSGVIVTLSIITFLCSFLNAIDVGCKTEMSSDDAIVYYRLLQLASHQEPIVDKYQLSKSVDSDHPEVDIPAALERLRTKKLVSLRGSSIYVNKTIDIIVTDA